MPIVQIEILEGRTVEQKRAMVRVPGNPEGTASDKIAQVIFENVWLRHTRARAR